MRTFIAIEIPGTIKEQLARLAARLRASEVAASWVRPEQIHLTLRFLGDVKEPLIEQLRAILRDAYRGVPPFDVMVRGTGAFPNPHRPSVVWVGMESTGDELGQANLKAEEAARAIGLPPENRKFRPHLTLARIRDPRASGPLSRIIEEEREFCAGGFRAASVSLFASKLEPRGAIHTRIEEFLF